MTMTNLLRAVAFVVALLAGASSVFAQLGQIPHYVQPAPSGGAPTWTNQAAAINNSCAFSNPCSITGLTIASGYDVFIICADGSLTDPTAVTLSAGCSGTLTKIAATNDEVNGVGTTIWAGTVTGGASCTVSVSSVLGNLGVAYGTLPNLSSTTAGTTCATTYNNTTPPYTCGGALTVSAGGFGISGAFETPTSTFTSSNTTIDAQATLSSHTIAISHTASTISTPGPSFSGINFGEAGVVGAPCR